MKFTTAGLSRKTVVLVALIAGGTAGSISQIPAAQGGEESSSGMHAVAVRKTSPYLPVNTPKSAMGYYQSAWGLDNTLVRQTASGNLIRFSYRVTEPARAKELGDDHATPYLYGQRSRAVLHIPVMDKVGQLRQTGTAETGKEYWMVFSNKGNLVRPGDRVNVIIGSFHADGLMVE